MWWEMKEKRVLKPTPTTQTLDDRITRYTFLCITLKPTPLQTLCDSVQRDEMNDTNVFILNSFLEMYRGFLETIRLFSRK